MSYVSHTVIWIYKNEIKVICQMYSESYSDFKGNIRTEERMKLRSSRSSSALLAAALSCTLFSCDDRGMVTPPCCHTLLVSDDFCGLGLSNFWASTEDEKISRPNKSASYKALGSEKWQNNHERCLKERKCLLNCTDKNTAETPVSNHPNFQAYMTAYKWLRSL